MPSSYTLGEHYEKFVRELVESGRYNSASEVLRDGLRLVEQREAEDGVRTEELKQLIQEGLASGDAGPLDMEEIIAEAKRRKANRQDAA